MSFDLERFINYLSHDVPQERIADAMGVSASHVSTLSSKDTVRDLVILKKGELAVAQLEERSTLTTITDKLLSRMTDLADDTESLTEATRAYISLKALSTPSDAQQNRSPRATLNVVVPLFLSQTISLARNTANEITEIDGRSMATAPTAAVLALAASASEDPEHITF